MRIFTPLKLTALFLLFCSPVFAGVNNITEEDGSPSVYPWKIKVSNGTLTDNSDGSASLSTNGVPAAPVNSVQYNSASSFGGDKSFSWNSDVNTLSISRDVGQSGYALVISSDTGAVLANISHDGTAMFNALAGGTLSVTQAATDSTTKIATTAFVANAVTASNPAVAVQAATTAASDTSGLTYSNGVSGIGATFTGSNNTAIVVDGYTFTALNQRLLVKNDTQAPSGAFNGVYYVTQVQTAILPPILTRALDYDQPSNINNTGAIPVVNGTINANTSWLLTSTVNTVGTDPLTYVKFSIAPTTIVTSAASLTSNAVMLGQGGQASATITADTATTDALFSTATSPAFRQIISSDIASGVFGENSGGTGKASYTKGDILVATGASSLVKLGVGANGTNLSADSSTASGVKWVSPPAAGSGTVTNSGTLTSNAVIIGGGTTVVSAITADTVTTHSLFATATSPAFRQINTSDIVGVNSVAQGGTNLSSGVSGGIPYFRTTTSMDSSALLTQYGVIYGGGAGATPVAITADTATTHFLASTATAPAFRQLNTADVVGVHSVAQGGTGLSIGVSGGIPYWRTTTSMDNSAALTASAVMVGGGAGVTPATITADTVVTHFLAATATTPAFRQPVTGDITGTQPVATGGTGITSGTSGGVPYFSNAGLMASSLLFAANAVVVGGGAGTAPVTITADSTAGHVLVSTATTPNFRQLLTGDSTGTLPVARGGTGITSGTANGVVILSNAGLMASTTADAATTHAFMSTAGQPAFRQILTTDVVGTYPSSGGSPGGATTQIQYNSASSFAGATLITTDGVRLSVGPGTSTLVSMDVAGNFRTVPIVLTDGATITPDASMSNFFTVTLAGAPRTLAAPINGVNGEKIIIRISQDATGSRKIGTAVGIKYGTDVPSFDATTTAGNKDYLVMVCNSNTASWDMVGISKGYN